MLKIRFAIAHDLPAITEIYNAAILETVATFDTIIKTELEQQNWFLAHDAKYPILVAEQENNIVGWGSLSAWSDRCAYSNTAENSIYIQKSFYGKGIGTALMKALLEAAQKGNLHTIIARITDSNQASIRLHEKFGFKPIGVMQAVGHKFGQYWDVLLMQKLLP